MNFLTSCIEDVDLSPGAVGIEAALQLLCTIMELGTPEQRSILLLQHDLLHDDEVLLALDDYHCDVLWTVVCLYWLCCNYAV